MDGFALTITDLLLSNGVPAEHIHVKRSLTVLPGFYRATKNYDFLVVDPQRKLLKAVIELKSLVGPSFGNNLNNRIEEALGAASDIWTAHREQTFGAGPAPWLGYLFLLEETHTSTSPVRLATLQHFSVRQEFSNSSYAQRSALFCRKMVLERQYNAACLLLSKRDEVQQRPNYTEPAADLTAQAFLSDLLRHAQ